MNSFIQLPVTWSSTSIKDGMVNTTPSQFISSPLSSSRPFRLLLPLGYSFSHIPVCQQKVTLMRTEHGDSLILRVIFGEATPLKLLLSIEASRYIISSPTAILQAGENGINCFLYWGMGKQNRMVVPSNSRENKAGKTSKESLFVICFIFKKWWKVFWVVSSSHPF